MKLKKIPKKYNHELLGTLRHFLEDGWAIRVTKKTAELLNKYMPYLAISPISKKEISDGRPFRVALSDETVIPVEHLTFFYKNEMEYYKEAFWTLSDQVRELADKL